MAGREEDAKGRKGAPRQARRKNRGDAAEADCRGDDANVQAADASEEEHRGASTRGCTATTTRRSERVSDNMITLLELPIGNGPTQRVGVLDGPHTRR